MKIISIQGSRREVDDYGNLIPFEIGDKVKVMEKYGDEVITPITYWYSDLDLFKTINNYFEKTKIDAIIGNSAGGYMAYYFSNYYKIPTLLLNPAIASTSEAPTIQKLPDEFYKAPGFNKQMVLLGNRDLKVRHGVDFDKVIDFFQENGFFKQGNKMFIEEGMSHQVPLNIFEKYFDKFYQQMLKA